MYFFKGNSFLILHFLSPLLAPDKENRNNRPDGKRVFDARKATDGERPPRNFDNREERNNRRNRDGEEGGNRGGRGGGFGRGGGRGGGEGGRGGGRGEGGRGGRGGGMRGGRGGGGGSKREFERKSGDERT